MQSLRMLGRLASRSALRPAPIRSLATFSRNTSSLRPTWQSIKKPSYPAFSTSIARREPAGESDQELSAKLDQERSIELQTRDAGELPDHLKDFLDNTSWKIEDSTGTHNVILTKDFGNEQIKVEFSINDLLNLDEDEIDASEEDGALPDETFDSPKATINQSGNKLDVMPEDSIAPADRGEDGEEQAASPAYELSFDVTITKPGGKTLYISCETTDGSIAIENVMNGAPGPSDAESTKYTGPQMTHIDPDLLAMLDVYLEERGVDASLASFALNYNDFKEQREYVDWLKNLKEFVDA